MRPERVQISSGAEDLSPLLKTDSSYQTFPSKPQSTHATVFHVHNVFRFKAKMSLLL